MFTDFLYFFTAITLLNYLIYYFHDYFSKIGIPFDKPDEKRKFHKGPVLISGGTIFFINIIFLIIFLKFRPISIENYNLLNLLYLFGIFFFIFGFIDDKIDLNPWIKFIFMILILWIFLKLSDVFIINQLKFSFTDKIFSLGKYSFIITLICYLLFINAFNMFDGINLQSSIFSFSLIFYFILINFSYELNLLLLPSMILFSILNFKNKSFLGDGGCYMMAFILGSYSINAYNEGYIPNCDIIFLLMILPGFDMLRLFLERISKKKSPFSPDRNHFHHILLSKISYSKTILLIANIIFINLLLIFFKFDTRVILFLFLCTYFYFMLKFRY